MKIFFPPESSASPEAVEVKKNGKGKKRAAVAPKLEVSDRDIREKLASHVETSNTAKSQVLQKNSKALGAGFMNEKDSHLLLSDVKLNDPTDSNTQEKLKTVLRNGAFSFNPREKETLEKILADN